MFRPSPYGDVVLIGRQLDVLFLLIVVRLTIELARETNLVVLEYMRISKHEAAVVGFYFNGLLYILIAML